MFPESLESQQNPASIARRLDFRVIGLTPFHHPDVDLAAALTRTEALATLDTGRDPVAATQAVRAFLESGQDVPIGLLVRAELPAEMIPEHAVIILPGPDYDVQAWAPRAVLAQVTSLEEARRAAAAGAAGLIAKGTESGGRIGDEGAYILLQRLVGELDLPIWVQGGIGADTAAACVAGGAHGVVLDGQLALARESRLPAALEQTILRMDGSETTVIGGHRILARPGSGESSPVDPPRLVERLGIGDLVPCGQDAALAASLSQRFRTAGRIVGALLESMDGSIQTARRLAPLAPGSAFATAHQIPYPILQGPMTRVSDTAAFASAVAEAGGLPFIALSLLTGSASRKLLEETGALLGDRAWGVGILGFADPELRAEQIQAIEAVRPPVALIAGGRPSQARALEQQGIATYLHVPSPGLLKQFLADGARRFIFEGRECGGHVGPRTSLLLWQLMLDELRRVPRPEELYLVFAGGIHDARSAAMVAVMAAPLVAKGAKIAVLMGTAYLFTAEAVASQAILPTYQQAALDCAKTVLLETAPGHATRCIDSPYVRTFQAERLRLEGEGLDSKAIWAQLEQLNLGRLRIASKGVKREGDRLESVDEGEQYQEGMYMIGEVATMRGAVISMHDLHREVTLGATDLVSALPIRTRQSRSAPPVDIAIIGMAGVFPGAEDIEAFWSNIVNGVTAFTEVDPGRWNPRHYYDPESQNGDKTPTKWGGFISDVPFDPLEFGIPPQSLAAVDPAQLLSLRVARQALQDAGYLDSELDRSRVSVIFGAEAGADIMAAYGFRALYPQLAGPLPPQLDEHLPRLTEDSFPGVLANVIAGRIANRLDLGGINLAVDAACASSLAALDAAVKELVLGGSDLVVCGGVDLHNGIGDYLMFAGVHALSRSGVCKPFDSRADGTVLGEAAACVVLKRLADARRDGDTIHAVIRAVAGASDGRSLGLTAPRTEGQVNALRRAYARSGLSPLDIGVLEAHGTGTVVGDRTELNSMTETFRAAGVPPARCTLGSVKSQIGHTKCAAGLASLIKVTMALRHRVLPPTVNIEQPNPAYDAATSPFVLSGRARPWVESRRHGAVSAFGFGGSNFHCVLSAYEDGEAPAAGLAQWPCELFLLRGREPAAALDQARRLLAFLDSGVSVKLRDLAATLALADEGEVQLAWVAGSLAELRTRLQAILDDPHQPEQVWRRAPVAGRIAWLFPGQGSQRPGMLRELFVAFPPLHRLLEAGQPWLSHLCPPTPWTAEEEAKQRREITDTRVAQPTLGIAGLALAELLTRVGIRPSLVGGHSYGELVALCVAGAFSEAALLDLSRERAESILEAAGEDPGTMAAVSADARTLDGLLAGLDGVVLANQNAPLQTVISGPVAAIGQAMERLAAAGVAAKSLPVAAAFHSPLVAGASHRLRAYLDRVAIDPPAIDVWSNTSADPYPQTSDAIRDRLAEHVAKPVRFVEQIEAMYEQGARLFIEVGPGTVLTGLVNRILGEREHLVVACDADRGSDLRGLLGALARLATSGVDLNCEPLFAGRGAVRLDLSRPQVYAPSATTWLVNGWRVRPLQGEPPKNRLRPAVSPVYSGSPQPLAQTDSEETVLSYLRNLRELAAAQRDVMLSYLGNPPVAASRPLSALATRETLVPLADAPDQRPTATPAPAERRSVTDTLLAIVAEKTGYPREMLGLEQDLEADLSIDSIKRVEILGALAERLSFGQSSAMDRDQMIEQLATHKTLQGIISWLEGQGGSAQGGDATASAAVHSVDIQSELLALVSDKTGYPREMLGLDQDLEAELSIDSIKRVEILGALADRLDLGRGAADGRDQVIEQLAARKTLREILEWLARPVEAAGTSQVQDHADAPALAEAAVAAPQRYVPSLIPLAPPDPDLGQLRGQRWVLSETTHPVARHLQARLEAAGASVAGRVAGDPMVADGFLYLGALQPLDGVDPVKELLERSQEALAGGARWMFAVTGLGGRLGQDGPADGKLIGAGVAGFIKSLAKERPDLRIGVIDVRASADPEQIAADIIAELASRHPQVEVGYDGGLRLGLRPMPAPLPESSAQCLPLEADSVALVTGGARGITAAAAVELARRARCHLVLVGRSPLPAPEPPGYAQASDLAGLRRLLIEAGRLNEPRAIESECRRILGAREVRGTLEAIQAAGATCEYHALDVRDTAAFAELIEQLYRRHGRLDLVVHGAGIIEDKWLKDKDRASFDRVFDTKVGPARLLAERLRDDVKAVVLFSSVAGAFGNRGQCDYAAAGDTLDKLAWSLQPRLPGRVVAIDWGPWSGAGMVSDELAREYGRRGIGLIDLREGIQSFIREISTSGVSDPQVVLMAGEPDAFEPAGSHP